MFMAKSELKNTAQLIRVKLSYITSDVLVVSAILIATVLLVTLILNIFQLFHANDFVQDYWFLDYSFWFMMGLALVITFTNSYYRRINSGFDVYPQTGVSRFLSTQALPYMWIVLAAVLCAVLYLIQYEAVAGIASFLKNIHLMYKFDAGFVLAGFVVMIIYASVIAGFAALVAAIVRKFGIPALMFLVFITGLIMSGPQQNPIVEFVAGPLILEPGLILFFIKGAAICLVLFIVTFFVDKHTIYCRESARISDGFKSGITAICVIILLIISADSSGGRRSILGSSAEIEWHKWRDAYSHGEIVLDASALPKESKINISDGVNIIDSQQDIQNDRRNYYVKPDLPSMMNFKYDPKELSDFTGEKLVISYKLPYHMINWRELVLLTNPKVSARLDGTTLYIDYTYDKNVKAAVIPVWRFMRQFDYYKDVAPPYITSTHSDTLNVSIKVL